MKRLLMTIALTCALSATALAGDMPIVPAAGDMPTVPAAASSGAQSSAVVTVLLTIINLVV